MRIEIDLITNVPDIEDLDVVLDQCERNNQGRQLLIKIGDHVRQFSFFVSAQAFLEMANNVLEHIHMFAHRRLHGQHLHEEFPVLVGKFLWTVLMSLPNQPPEHLALLRVMGQKQIFVARVELHQGLPRDSPLNEILPAAVTEDPLDKILPECRLAEPPFFLDWNQRELLDKSPRKEPDSVPAWHPMFIVDPNSLDPAAR